VTADVTGAIGQFQQAWNNGDRAQRLLLLRSCCVPEAEFVSPEGITRGLETFNATIDAFLRAYPRAEVRFGAPDHHNGHARVRWRTFFNDGAREPVFGDDFIDFDGEGRIISVVSFNADPVEP
jgi:hypothetical protein